MQQNPYPRVPTRTKSILTGIFRFDWVWVFPNFKTWVREGQRGCKYPPRTHTQTCR